MSGAAFNLEAALVAWLAERLDCPVSQLVPATRPTRFVTLQRTGGAMEIGLDHPVIAVDAWGESPFEASELALQARDLIIHQAVGIPNVRHVEVGSGPYLSPDADSGQPAYRITFNLTTQP